MHTAGPRRRQAQADDCVIRGFKRHSFSTRHWFKCPLGPLSLFIPLFLSQKAIELDVKSTSGRLR